MTLQPPPWTLADVLSNSRYWAFVLSVLVTAAVVHSFSAILPLLAMQMNASQTAISLFSVGSVIGCGVGGALALVLMPHRPKLTLMLPQMGLAVGVAGLAIAPSLWISSPQLLFFGVCAGAFA